MNNNSPELSVIVCAYNDEATIEFTLAAIKESTYQDYELIVVDDGSTDSTLKIAEAFASKVIEGKSNQGRVASREKAFIAARANLIVNIDSDVVIEKNTLEAISLFFNDNQDVDAVTGLLSSECPVQGIFTQYKNFYMNDVFKNLSNPVDFLYGSIFAFRKECVNYYSECDLKYTDDTWFGQALVCGGKTIILMKELVVTHLKKYSFREWIRNEFVIPADWAQTMLFFMAKKKAVSDKRGIVFAHASAGQVGSIFLAYLFMLSIIIPFKTVAIVVLLGWSILNARFFKQAFSQKGFLFCLSIIFIHFSSDVIKGLGILWGLLKSFQRKACGCW